MPSHTLRSLRVLIVDDDPLIRTTFAEQLDSQRAITVVAAASSGRQAISLLMTGQQPIDVVLLDSDMPEMDGAQTARAIYERFPRMPIVMFTVFSRDLMIEIPWQQARYLLAEHKTVFLITGDGQRYELPKTLVSWEELLGDKVIRIHRNAIVFRHTLDCLIRLDEEEDESNAIWGAKVLDVPKPLPVSRRQLATLRKILKKQI